MALLAAHAEQIKDRLDILRQTLERRVRVDEVIEYALQRLEIEVKLLQESIDKGE